MPYLGPLIGNVDSLEQIDERAKAIAEDVIATRDRPGAYELFRRLPRREPDVAQPDAPLVETRRVGFVVEDDGGFVEASGPEAREIYDQAVARGDWPPR